jgi:glycosyltransferase involved in cell wall biosynthesis
MRILLATDAWEPQVNGVVRTLTKVMAELKAMGHEVDVVSPDQFPTFPLPTYPEIKLAIGAYEPVMERFKSFEPEAIHIATEGPIGLAARRICLEWKLPFTTSYHTRSRNTCRPACRCRCRPATPTCAGSTSRRAG